MLIVDTGVFLAAADRNDPDHLACRDLLGDHPGPLITTAAVVAETGWLIDRRLGPATEAAFYRSIVSGGLEVENLGGADWARVAELVEAYADLRIGGTDASLIAVAERLGAGQVATLDHRHFRVVRPRHVEAFELLP